MYNFQTFGAEEPAAPRTVTRAVTQQPSQAQVVITDEMRRAVLAEIAERQRQFNPALVTAQQKAELNRLGAIERPAAEALLATAQAPYTAALHNIMEEYHTENTPLGAAHRVHAHISGEVVRGNPVDRVIADLALDDNRLMTVAVGRSQGGVAAATVYSLDGGQLIAAVDTKRVDPWQLLAQAADGLTTGYMSISEPTRARAAPGIIATRGRAIQPAKDYDDSLIHIVANTTAVDPAFAQGINCLTAPHYRLALKAPGVENGLPVGTATVCNQDVPGAKTAEVVSSRDGVTKRRTFVFDAAPRWTYCFAGRTVLLRHIYEAVSTLIAFRGDPGSNIAGATMHAAMLSDHNAKMEMRDTTPSLSHHRA
jgi:hypothetical protein